MKKLNNKEYDVLLPLTKGELMTLWRTCYLATEELITRTDDWGKECYNKTRLIKDKISDMKLVLSHKEYCEKEIEREYGESFIKCKFMTDELKSERYNVIYSYDVLYKTINQETYDKEQEWGRCDIEIIPVTTDEDGNELGEIQDYMYEVYERI